MVELETTWAADICIISNSRYATETCIPEHNQKVLTETLQYAYLVLESNSAFGGIKVLFLSGSHRIKLKRKPKAQLARIKIKH